MKLRNLATSAVFGAVVLTAVPSMAVPFAAYACDGSTLCQDEDPGDEGGGNEGGGGWPGGDVGDPSGGGGSEGGGGWSGDPGDGGDGGAGPSGGGGSVVELADGSIGQPVDATLPQVVVTGYATLPGIPAGPGIPVAQGDGSGPQVTLHRRGRSWDERASKCLRNQSTSVEAKYSRGVSYTVSTQTSTNLSFSTSEILTAQLGTQLNTSINETYNLEFTLKPGESWAVFVEYQTSVYAVTTRDFWGNYSTEFINVTQPTGVVSTRGC
ncbi:DUF6426 family protein [Kitasatospora misakiensis]|uniref:DUF6426 family protein n=1 Tax=Kitasatospora misakiensis TaxID=67330 RepID=A0ABW0XB62_9ACTN